LLAKYHWKSDETRTLRNPANDGEIALKEQGGCCTYNIFCGNSEICREGSQCEKGIKLSCLNSIRS